MSFLGHVFFYYLFVRKKQIEFYEVIDMKIYVGGSKNIDNLQELEEEEYIIGITDEVINELANSDWVNDVIEEE